jgi:hypothetical protein
MRVRVMLSILLAVVAFQPSSSFSKTHRPANPSIPSVQANPSTGSMPILPDHLQCLNDQHEAMGFNNTQVEKWEKTTQDQFLARGMVQGQIIQVYPNETGHNHFAISLGNGQGIEVIYQYAFGALPPLKVGMNVIACGDYITVGPHAQEPSPMPAIIHWVHWNPGNRDGGKHPGGFLVINNVAYGITGNGN